MAGRSLRSTDWTGSRTLPLPETADRVGSRSRPSRSRFGSITPATVSAAFHKLLQRLADNLGPSFHEIPPRKCGRVGEGFQTGVSQFQPRLIPFREQFERNQGIAWLTSVPPCVSQFSVRNDFRHAAAMIVNIPLVFDLKAEFDSGLSFEFLQIEIPL